MEHPFPSRTRIRVGPALSVLAAILVAALTPRPAASQAAAHADVEAARAAAARPGGNGARFEVSFAASAHGGPLTGRAFLFLSKDPEPEPRLQTGLHMRSGTPMFGVAVEAAKPGDAVVFVASAHGFPYTSIDDLPAGEYYAQALFNVYTEFRRADGHTVWMHDDQWEGQKLTISPGNLYSPVQRVYLDPAQPQTVRLVADRVIPPVEIPPDTEWVKRFRFQSKILSDWWGRPIYLGATVLLPKGYAEHPSVKYPVNYIQGHFSLGNPDGFNPIEPAEGETRGRAGYEFYRWWTSDEAPRFLAVTFQHPTPYYDDSYAVNSENNGPYGDAILQELIPEVEKRFRVIGEPWSRVLTGGSTGGWESLALQIFHPDFFGGTWSLCPDPVDFRAYGLVNIYEDENAYWRSFNGIKADRGESRETDGQLRYTIRQGNSYEWMLGPNSRSGQQWHIWEATYSPVGSDGYPQRLWDWKTGAIDRRVAEAWRKYDLTDYLKTNWSWIGPKLVGKLHVYTGDMDTYFLNNAVVLMEEFLESTTAPYYAGVVRYGDRQPHCWGPRGREVYELFDAHIRLHAPEGADLASWHY